MIGERTSTPTLGRYASTSSTGPIFVPEGFFQPFGYLPDQFLSTFWHYHKKIVGLYPLRQEMVYKTAWICWADQGVYTRQQGIHTLEKIGGTGGPSLMAF
jgi:hypothetical protein